MNISKDVIGQGEDVVVIHGWGCNRKDMQPVVDALAKRYRVTNIDLPGIGKSDWDPNIQTIEDIAECVLPHLPQKAIYVAWSFGGLVTIAIAAKHPERIKQFVGIGTTPKLIETEGWLGFPQPGFSVAFAVIKEQGLKNLLKDDYANEFAEINPKPTRFAVLNHLLEAAPEIPQNVLFTGIEIVDKTDLRPAFAQMQCPIDFIMGEADQKVLFASAAQHQKLNPRTKIHSISGAKHMPFWTHPQEFNQILNSIV